jgi:hypothetical protein
MAGAVEDPLGVPDNEGGNPLLEPLIPPLKLENADEVILFVETDE